MKGLKNITFLAALSILVTSCNCWSFFDNCNNPCSKTDQTCSLTPHIWDNNHCSNESYDQSFDQQNTNFYQ